MKFIDIHTHQKNTDGNIISVTQLRLKERIAEPSNYYSVGIHPWDIEKDYDFSEISMALNNKNVIALGEVGLDTNISTPIELQIEIFKKQLDLNKKNKLPVIIHNVKALRELISIRKKYFETPWIIHGFNKSIEMARQLLDYGCYLSFGASLMNEKSPVRAVFREIPLESVFLETDDQTDYDIVAIYRSASELREMELEDFKQALVVNFKKVFGEL